MKTAMKAIVIVSSLMVINIAAAETRTSNAICKVLGSRDASVNTKVIAGDAPTLSAQAFDGLLDTSAYVSSIVGAFSTFSIRGTAQSGLVAPSNGFAGVALATPPSGQYVQIWVATYLSGSKQDQGLAGIQTDNGSQVCPGICDNKGGVTFYGIPTTKTYDSIEATVSIQSTSSRLEIKELCYQ